MDRSHAPPPPEVLDFDLTQNTASEMMRDVLPHLSRAPRTAPGVLSRSTSTVPPGNSGLQSVRPSPVAPLTLVSRFDRTEDPRQRAERNRLEALERRRVSESLNHMPPPAPPVPAAHRPHFVSAPSATPTAATSGHNNPYHGRQSATRASHTPVRPVSSYFSFHTHIQSLIFWLRFPPFHRSDPLGKNLTLASPS